MEYLTPNFWKKRENHPFPWVLVGLVSVVAGWLIGLGVVAVVFLAGPDGIAEVW